MNKFKLIWFVIVFIGFFAGYFLFKNKQPGINSNQPPLSIEKQINENPLSIEAMRKRNYPGSDLIIEKTLSPKNNYNQYIVSYLSDGLKIYGLLTIPKGKNPPLGGWPVIIFNHGYLPPKTYNTTERYIAYVDGFAQNGYVVFKPDYRGHGNSEGQPEGAYYSPAYATDVLNALSSIKRYQNVNPDKIGMWGHSMGGNITLRNIVVDTKDIKAAVIWGGVVGSYEDLMNNWQHKVKYQPSGQDLALRNNYRRQLTNLYGTPSDNPLFWQVVDPTDHLSDITTPVQLHTGGNDEEVPVAFSASLYDKLQQLGKTAGYYNYPGGNHNLSSPNFQLAMRRSLDFFNKYLKS